MALPILSMIITQSTKNTTHNKISLSFKASPFGARVSGGHLCEAEAPTEPVGETVARLCRDGEG